MGRDIELPVIVVEDEDITVYLTQKDAESHLETTDVMSGSYEAFDAKGRLLQLKTRGNRVLMSLAETEPTHSEALSRILVGYLTFLEDPIDKSAELDLLVRAAMKYAYKPLCVTHLLRRGLEALLRLRSRRP